jgi:hypothetical protein
MKLTLGDLCVCGTWWDLSQFICNGRNLTQFPPRSSYKDAVNMCVLHPILSCRDHMDLGRSPSTQHLSKLSFVAYFCAWFYRREGLQRVTV